MDEERSENRFTGPTVYKKKNMLIMCYKTKGRMMNSMKAAEL